jgi:hypothetical protein
MNKRSRAVLYLCFVFFLILSGTAFSQEFYKDKAVPPLEKILQICDQLGKYYIGQYKDSSGVFHLFFHRTDMTTVQIVLYHLDTDIWVASGYCSCAGCSRVITK